VTLARRLFFSKNRRPSIASLPGPKIPIFYKKKYFFKIFFITKNPNAIIVLTILFLIKIFLFLYFFSKKNLFNNQNSLNFAHNATANKSHFIVAK
jgi:hypothetical protein